MVAIVFDGLSDFTMIREQYLDQIFPSFIDSQLYCYMTDSHRHGDILIGSYFNGQSANGIKGPSVLERHSFRVDYAYACCSDYIEGFLGLSFELRCQPPCSFFFEYVAKGEAIMLVLFASPLASNTACTPTSMLLCLCSKTSHAIKTVQPPFLTMDVVDSILFISVHLSDTFS
mmetsp:Transcript_51394/g.124098  ORF Transcript_51394/g.124098 Transcript_51394/m.124098 type:complete len:173 (+) Transcript_51394:52-570(+)